MKFLSMWHIGASSAQLCLEMCSDKNFLRLGMLYGSDVAGFPTKGGRENIGGGGALPQLKPDQN